MHPAEIQASLKLKGHSQKDVADACEVRPSAVSAVINGRGRSRQVEEHIAGILRLPLGRIWPQWYVEDAGAFLGVREDPYLVEDERRLIETYRALTHQQKAQAQALIDVLARGGVPPGGQHVSADRRGVAAIGDVNIGKGSGRGRK